METTNHEYYVSLEVAKLLKEAGFDWACEFYFTDNKFSYYDPNRIILMRGERETNWNVDEFTMFVRNKPIKVHNGTYYDDFREKDITRLFYSAPTLDIAQRWLREKEEIDVNILTDFDSVKRFYYVRYVVKDGHYKTYYISENQSYVYFNTYEEAQEAGIKKALEIILEEGE